MGKRKYVPWKTSATAVVTGVLAVITAVFPDWIEVAGWNPDRSSGALEWSIVAVLAFVSLASAIAARVQWRHHALAAEL